MPKRYVTLVVFLCVCASSYSQHFTISGSVIDTGENKPIHNAVVSILRPADSVLLKFIRTKQDGTFSIPGLTSAKNIVLITYPGYADYVEVTKDSSKSEFALGKIPLTPKSELLEAVIIKQQIAAIRMKGDTLEFKADSFAVRPGAAVDELLRRLPGITVNRNGEITAQGERVNKVLVDGEEFFSDDPAVVIKNLQADAVENVQLFDKKSDQAEFTGVDDGKRSKTINLTLKENKKKGYHLRASVGGGTNETFDNDVMFNAFKGKKKIAAFGIMSNTGRQDLSWRDNDQFGGGNNVQFDEETGYFMSSMEENATENIEVENGLPKAWTGGAHFSNAWNGDKEKVNTNYRYYKNNQRSNSQTITQNILPDTQFFNTSNRRAFSTYTRNNLKGIYDLKFDSLSSMKVTVNGNAINAENASRSTSAALNADSMNVNNNERTANSQASKKNLSVNAIWRKKFRTKGRTLSINYDQQLLQQVTDGFLNSMTDYFNPAGQIDSSERIDQKKNLRQDVMGMRATVVYTEPVAKNIFASVSYGYNYRKSDSYRTVLNNTGNGYDKRDSSLSNDFRFRYNIQSAGLDFKYNKKKIIATIGSGVNYAMYRQSDLLKDTARRYSFVNYFPKVFFRWAPSQQRTFNITYRGTNTPPTLEQLQPVRENADPLNIRIGNPELRQAFSHSVDLFYHEYKIINNRGMYFGANATVNDNAITNSIVTDRGGKTTTQAINVDGNYFINFYGSYRWKVKPLDVDIGFGPGIMHSKNTNRVNGLNNVNYSSNYSLRLGVGRYKEKHNFSIDPEIGYTFAKSTVRPDLLTKYFTSNTEANMWTQLPHKFEIATSVTLQLRQKTAVFAGNLNSTKWDAWISKKFFSKDILELKLSVFDILDQNIGFSRNTTSNMITQNSYENLRRFWMLSAHFNITKTP